MTLAAYQDRGRPRFSARVISGTEKVPLRTFATKISPNFRVNFLVRFASKPPFLWVSALELFRKFLGAVRAIFWLWGSFLAPDYCSGALFSEKKKAW